MKSKELDGNQGTKFRRPVKRSQIFFLNKRSQVFACKLGIMIIYLISCCQDSVSYCILNINFNIWHKIKHSINVVIVTFIVSFYKEQIFLLQGCSSEMGWERVVVVGWKYSLHEVTTWKLERRMPEGPMRMA